jgi:hypothetical protein
MANKFGEVRTRRDVHNMYLARGGADTVTPGKIGTVNTYTDFDSKSSGSFNSAAPPSPENLRYKKNTEYLKNYFNDKQTHYFKNGLEIANKTKNKKNVSSIENLDEDPIIFGFDFIINEASSPLYQDMNSFFDASFTSNLSEVQNRRSIYTDFIEQMELLFLSTRGGAFDTFKGHYIVGIDGLDNLITKANGISSTKQFADYGNDKITLTLREDVHLSGGYMSMLYNTLAYSKINGKTIIPDHLLRFDASIVISEIRNYKRIRTLLRESDADSLEEVISLVNDNVSRYVYNIYDCQFEFHNHTHDSKVENVNRTLTDSFDMKLNYKFSTLEMEKFKFNPDEIDLRYLNDGNRLDPTKKYVGGVDSAVRRNEFINRGYNESDPYTIYGDVPTNNNIEENQYSEDVNYDQLESERANSLKNSTAIQQEQNESVEFNTNLERVKLSGYAELEPKDGESGQLIGTDKDEQSGLAGLKDRAKTLAINSVKKRRDKLLNDTIANIRRATGITRMASPKNVYEDVSGIQGFLKNELGNFANNALTGLIGGIDDAVS